jgi:hypothetical protein
LDNVYQAVNVSVTQTSVPGIGLTYITRVVVSVDSFDSIVGFGMSSFFGEFSWGRIFTPFRISPKEFVAYNNGLVGISTSPIIERINPLRTIGYSTSII